MSELRYSLLQKSLENPPVDALRRAFESIRTLTSADAPTLAKDAFGILVKALPAEEAATLQRALLQQGIETELVPDKLLPQLPAAKYIRQFEFGTDCLVTQDPMGRPVPIEYKQLSILAAGEVEYTKFEREGKPFSSRPSHVLSPLSSLRLELEELDKPSGPRTRGKRSRKHLLELIVGQGAARFTVEADVDAHLLFRALGERRTQDFTTNLALLIRELSRAAPSMILNRGAYALKATPPTTCFYPTPSALNEELTWILWHLCNKNST